MTAKLRSRWWYIRKHRIVALIITLVIVVAALIFVGYQINGTGFSGYYITSTTRTISGSPPTITRTEIYQPGKMLWDWLQLLIIPIVIAVGGYLFNLAMSHTEQRNTKDNQREAALQGYIDKISELLLEKQLGEPTGPSKTTVLARVRTLSTLHQLDADRKGLLIRFLYEARLIDTPHWPDSPPNRPGWPDAKAYEDYHKNPILSLNGADLSSANLSGAVLSVTVLAGGPPHGAALKEANLKEAYLHGADLSRANLSRSDLREAHLNFAKLSEADLREADLAGAWLGSADLQMANLSGTDLRGVALRGVALSKADLSRANLSRSDLREAHLNFAKLSGADLSKADLSKPTSAEPSSTMPVSSMPTSAEPTSVKPTSVKLSFVKHSWRTSGLLRHS